MWMELINVAGNPQKSGLTIMKLRFGNDLEDFRREVRAFLRDNLPTDIAERTRRISYFPRVDDMLGWMRILHKQGWSVPNWPVEYGGTGWDPLRLHIFNDELAQADAPEIAMSNQYTIGPLIYKFGSQAQKDFFLPPTRGGEYLWAQGFSEPGSGSDLASLRTTARRDGDHYIVKGQKIWTSGAHLSKWIFALVKTDTTVKPQRGISLLLIDLATPGISVRTIRQINTDAHLCEVFFDDVRVPVENRVGEENQAWNYAKELLNDERTLSAYVYWSKRELKKARAIAEGEKRHGKPLIDDPVFQSRLARLEAQVQALDWSVLRVLANEKSRYSETAQASVLKVRGSELQQAVTELQMDALGQKALRSMPIKAVYAHRDDDPLWPAYALGRTEIALLMRAATIYGGTKQVQKNILAKQAFGL